MGDRRAHRSAAQTSQSSLALVKFYWTAAPMTVEGLRKGEPSTKSMLYGLRTQPALLVRGSSRRIMSMRFRPANIRVINRRASSEAVIGPAVQNPLLKAHQRDHVPPTPPVETFLCARTVLAFKGSLRRAKLRRALDRCAPFRPSDYRDGRLRREHDAIPWNQKTKTSAPKKRLTGRSISGLGTSMIRACQGKNTSPCT